jgi:hydrogenase/urease accessory protein HupE
MFGTLVYGLCSFTALLCAVLLLRAYGRSRYRLLFWSGICFAGLTVNNFLLMVDKVVLPESDLSVARSAAALFAMIVLMYGLIFDEG